MIHSRPTSATHPASVTPIGDLRRPLLERERDDLRIGDKGTPLMAAPVNQLTVPFTVGLAPFTVVLLTPFTVGRAIITVLLLAPCAILRIGKAFVVTLVPQLAVSGVVITATLLLLFTVGLEPFTPLLGAPFMAFRISTALPLNLIKSFAVGGIMFAPTLTVGCGIFTAFLQGTLGRTTVGHSFSLSDRQPL